MAYDKVIIFEQSLELSQREGFFFVQDVIDYLACGKTTFYTLFPDDSNELNAIKDNLFKNRIDQKIKLRKKMFDSGSSSDTIALYKLIGNDEERKSLSTNWQENTHKGNIGLNVTPLEFFDTPNEEDQDQD